MGKQMKNKTIASPKGFLAAGIYCGVKESGKHDLGMLACPTGANAAAVFTTNKIVSAGVTVSKAHVNAKHQRIGQKKQQKRHCRQHEPKSKPVLVAL